MKKLLFTLTLFVSLSGFSQTIQKDANGNYHTTKVEDKKTGHTYTDEKGTVYDIYTNSKGKPYIMRKSKKTGKEYKSYLKLEA
jgi:hypothetical protein